MEGPQDVEAPKTLACVAVPAGTPRRSGTNLRGARLAGSGFSKANLPGTILRTANLPHAYFTEADLVGAELSNSNLTGADLTAADLRRSLPLWAAGFVTRSVESCLNRGGDYPPAPLLARTSSREVTDQVHVAIPDNLAFRAVFAELFGRICV